MSGFSEQIVREYFEVNGFLVRPLRKYTVQSRKKIMEEAIELVVYNPMAHKSEPTENFQLFSGDILRLERAVVVVKGWHTSRFTPGILQSSSKVFDFLKKDVLNKSNTYFPVEDPDIDRTVSKESGSFSKILVLPGLPTSDPYRSESIGLLKEVGVDGIIAFSTILENLLRYVEVNHSYQQSDLLQMLRILKIYDMVKTPQMTLFN
jgi:hypothetical protein